MLTADLAQSWQRGDQTGPRLIDAADADYLSDAAALIKLFQEHDGRARLELDEALAEHVGLGTDYRIQRGLIKLLFDRCTFETVAAKDPVEIRRALFRKAGAHYPLLNGSPAATELVAEVARELECPPTDLLVALYADLPERQKLISFERIAPRELLDLYNVAQAQALLYRCVEMRLTIEPQAPSGYRELFNAIKAYRLLHTIKGNAAEGYEVRVDGPLSLFQRSQKYGVQMAVFLPALLLCTGWHMRAEIAPKPPHARAFFELDSRQKRLRSHYRTVTFYAQSDEDDLAERWARCDTPWTLEMNSEVVDLGASAFIPDYVLAHPDGRRVYLELLGFWTPQYLHERLREFQHAAFDRFILTASDELRGSRDPLPQIPPHVVVYKHKLNPAEVIAAIDKTSDNAHGATRV
jgi:predicted nuclease of restriction endonuclease-like RecB superfamily